MPNRLSESSSPYLLQHAGNPVDWFEWSDPALASAKERDVPIFLSIGYSACHWCHVMAHESFEDPDTAAYMNDHFVNIKVDREERPDIDRIYMDAVQAMTGQGGWPMSVFLTPEGKPILAGTYYPSVESTHHPSFMTVMAAVADAWTNRRAEVDDQAERLTEAVRRSIPPGTGRPSEGTVDRAVDALLRNFDSVHGGFGGAPKFPQSPNLELLLRVATLDPDGERTAAIRDALTKTLDEMARGGIYDHLSGGFARYAVDRAWRVPHFEKMLYDNATLARVYLRAGQVLGLDRYRNTAVETLDYLLRDMMDPGGGLHAAEDADSEGEEGKFYAWGHAEFTDVVGEPADVLTDLYGVTESGNFEGANVLYLARSFAELSERFGLPVAEIAELRRAADAKLLARRNTRPRPGRDDKVITAWNGLAIRALAEAGAVLRSPRYLDAAESVAHFCLDELTTPGGRLLRSVRAGRGGVPAFCDDYASLAIASLTLYQVTGKEDWFAAGQSLVIDMIDLFSDEDGPGFFASGRDAEKLISRPKNLMDNPSPSGNSLAAEALQMLFALTGDAELPGHIEGVFAAAASLFEQYPGATGHLLSVLAVDRPGEVAVIGETDARNSLVSVIWEEFRPGFVLAQGHDETSGVPLLAERSAGDAGARAYVCEDFVCALPVDTPEDLRLQLSPRAGSRI